MPGRVYRDDLRCPHCGSSWMPKYGASRGSRPTAAAIASITTPRRATAITTQSRSRAKR